MLRTLSLSLFAALIVITPGRVGAQQGATESRNGHLRVYLECATFGCDSRHFRQEISYVNWVRDVQDAQIHLILTSQSTGSGQEYLLDFLGREDLQGEDDQLTYQTSNTDTDDERIQGLTGVLAVGLARYAVAVGQVGPFTVRTPTAAAGEAPTMPPGMQGEVHDPWNYWVFRVSGDIEISGEESERARDLGGSFSANRTTEVWNISLFGRGSLQRDEYDVEDGNGVESTIVDERDDWNVEGRVFYAIAPRWSAGFEVGANSSTRNNTEVGGQLGTGLEFSFFPYEDWTRRRMTLQALVYTRYFDYDETTIYGEDTQRVWEASARWSLGFRQPWGTANLTATAEAYLHDPSTFYRLSAGGRMSIRLMRGLEWNANAQVSKIRDQIFLSAAKLTPEEVLLQRRQLPTDYSFEVSTGFSFTFGSIYNNVVNNRFGGGGPGGGGGGPGRGRF